jgi:phosphoserine phosphatase
MNPFDNNLPIVVDLDGTLIFDEISQLSARRFIRQFPWKLILLPYWYLKGVAYCKSRIAAHIDIDPKSLNFNPLVLDLIRKHKDHRIILATGADQKYAQDIAGYLGCFDHVIASDGILNNVSEVKAEHLDTYLHGEKYIYLGNSSQDIAVWKHAAYAIAVNAPATVIKRLQTLGTPYEVLSRKE